MEVFDFDRQLAKTFVKDFDIPAYTTDEYTFFYQVKTYGNSHLWNFFVSVINSFPGNIEEQKQRFYEEKHKLEDEIINTISNSEKYKEFNKMEFPEEFYEPAIPFKKIGSCALTDDNYYLSIDLKSANIQALYFMNSEITIGQNTWDDFVYEINGHNVMSDYLIASKHVRQYVFGKLNPSRTITVEKHIMSKIYQFMVDNGHDYKVARFNNDEIVFAITNNDLKNVNLNTDKIKDLIYNELNFIVHVKIYQAKYFRLRNLQNKDLTQQFLFKRYIDGSYKVKNVPLYLNGIVYKLINDGLITPFDRHFCHDNMKCSILDEFELVDDSGNTLSEYELKHIK